ncbi:hypothetical protein D9756_008517 [Leucocoprinus leucothites]|uniref:USP8 dimerisation domain-containing protein n=1 Tax=Leucocoprinus leucothites TaxID=201217 RepID=A0A8H5CYT7_9AGAR|nr:hypothetical protein D9756_008517 [Leucoagaricus leucothites]
MSLRRTRDEIHTADAGSRHGSQRRPASIGELADRAIKFEWDASRDFKHCLRTAEGCRNQARAYQNAGDLEMAFVYFARAATIALEKLPAHPQFKTALTEAQRDNLGLNGQEILDCMGSIKPTLVERFNKWRAVHPDSPLLPLFDDQEPPSAPYDSKLTKALKDEAAAWREARETREREAEEDHFRQHQIEEENLQRQSSRHRPNVQRQPTMDPRRQDSIRLAGPPAYKPSAADYAFSQPPNPGLGHGSQSTKVVVMPPLLLVRRKLRRGNAKEKKSDVRNKKVLLGDYKKPMQKLVKFDKRLQ